MFGPRRTVTRRSARVFPPVTLLLIAAPAAAQLTRDNEVDWPRRPEITVSVPHTTTRAMTPTSTHATTHRPAPSAPRPSITVDPTTEAPSTRTLTVLVTSMASVAGMWGGAHAGLGVSDEYGSGWGDELVGAMVGAGLGSNLGAITTAGLIQANWGSTILGSLGGSALGVVVGVMVGEGVRSSGLGVAAYALTHGLTTTLAGGR